jgi:beta-glucosidase
MTLFDRALDDVSCGVSTLDAAAHRLVSEMTIGEKLGCLDGDLDCWPGLFDMMQGAYHRRTYPAAVVDRLGIPGIHFSDGPRGCVIGIKTAFPVSMARGATFDVDLERRIGRAIGAELRTEGATYYGGVCINLLRHPAWGRAQETYGEEPAHVGLMGAALSSGAQEHVMACVKHFALNSMENARFTVDVTADERALHEVYLPHFRRVVDSGVASVMSAYNSVNGAYCGENDHLLTTVLRDEWGFDGFVISDFIFGLRDAVRSVRAGLDIEMPFRQQRVQVLAAAVADGTLPIAEVDEAVTRVVSTLLRFAPVFRGSTPDPEIANSAAHRGLAREAATKAIVLLRNEVVDLSPVLPLDPTLGRVAVLGRLARVPNLGDRGSSDVYVSDPVTPLAGLVAALGPSVVVHDDDEVAIASDADVAIVVVGFTHVDEGEYIDSAGTAGLMGTLFPEMTDADREAITATVGPPTTAPAAAEVVDEGEITGIDSSGFAAGGDRRSLRLSARDEQLILDTVSVNPRTVVVLMGGSATVMEAWRHRVPGIVQLWYPGVEGGHALADVLLGNVNPSGRLPFSVPTDEAHLPHFDPDATTATYDLWHGHWKLTRDGNSPAYPFGFGLSYTSFEMSKLHLHRHDDGVLAEVTVSNTGAVDGATVVQVYAGVPGSRFERPVERLVGFERVEVAAATSTTTTISLHLDELDVRQGDSWITEGGSYRIAAAQHVGDPGALVSSLDIDEMVRSARPTR